MRLDPEVARLKFERNIEALRAQEAQLRTWGVFVVRIEAPEVDVLFVPRRPARLTLYVGFHAQATELGSLSARAFGVRFNLDDFDQRPPSVTFCDPWTWQALHYDRLLRGHVYGPGGALMNVILPDHPTTKSPFLCIRGVREYHEHPQHTGDDWNLYRSSTSLFTLVQRVWQICIVDVFPNFLLQPNGVSLDVTINWESEVRKR